MPSQDKYKALAGSFNEYLKDFFEPPANHTTYHFGYKPVFDIIAATPGFPDVAVVDYGSGAGQFCAWLNDFGADVTGVEISHAMLETAKQNFPEIADHFIHADQLVPGMDGQFDICTMHFVTCEIPDAEQLDTLLSTASRLLKPNGKCIILTNNPEASPNGAEFVIWSTGPVKIDQPGSAFEVTIHTEEVNFTLTDRFWPKAYIEQRLNMVGFNHIEIFEPIINETALKANWKDETRIAPTFIFIATKA